ncbi:MAG: ABC transporter ATP-binding protein [Bdellovibrionales bacterium]|nr:ABC transporter ATP-binding protein [Oligoflexia bacterium]
MIEFRKLGKIYPRTQAGLAEVSGVVPDGQWVTLLGPSGSGKTTLLKLVSGLEKPGTGSLIHPYLQNEISYVFQDAALLPWKNVMENVTIPLTLKGLDLKAAEAKALPWLKKLKLERFQFAYPHELSGGLKMRVSIARALITEPKLLLLDEPFAALDEPIRIELGFEMRALWKSLRPTILMVTHSITEGLWLSERVLVLQGQPGQLALDAETHFGEDRELSLRGRPDFLSWVEKCFSLLKGQDEEQS